MATESNSASELVSGTPYCSFDTFERFVAGFSEHPIPPQIDTSLMANLSTGVQSQLMIALRFLGLIKQDSSTTPRFHELAKAHGDEDQWKAKLSEMMQAAYAEVVADLDMMVATRKQLEQAFSANGMAGSTRKKSIRFYLRARDIAGMKHSKYFGKTRTRSTGKRKRRQNGTPGTEDVIETPPTGMMRHPIYIPGKSIGHIEVPEDLDEADIPLIENVVHSLKLFTQRAAGHGTKASD